MAKKVAPQHKRRTEDELRKALAVIESKRDVLHTHADDEHVEALADAVTEMLALRSITTRLLQQTGTAQTEATSALKAILSS